MADPMYYGPMRGQDAELRVLAPQAEVLAKEAYPDGTLPAAMLGRNQHLPARKMGNAWEAVQALRADNAADAALRERASELWLARNAANSMYEPTINLLKAELGVAERSSVPSAPYISSTSDWVDLGLKQALMDAVKDPSVSRFAWAPGGVQADRFGLQRDVSQVQLINPVWDEAGTKVVRGDLVVTGRNGGDMLAEKGVSGDRIHELLGNEFSDRLFNAPSRDTGGMRVHELTGDGLKMGGEGMKSFYGDFTKEGSYTPGIVGTRLLKLVKALDPEAVKIEATEVSNGVKYPSITITPKLREKLLNEGQSLFVGSPGPVVPGNDQNKAEADDDFNAWLDNETQKFGVQR